VRTLCARRENAVCAPCVRRVRAVNTLQQLLVRCENVMDAVKTLWELCVDAVGTLWERCVHGFRTLYKRCGIAIWCDRGLRFESAKMTRWRMFRPCQIEILLSVRVRVCFRVLNPIKKTTNVFVKFSKIIPMFRDSEKI